MTILKIMERLAVNHLKPHITSSRHYCVLQSAYRIIHSAEMALVRVVDEILCNIDSRSVVVFIGLDISVAFDTINHYYYYYYVHLYCATSTMCNVSVKVNRRRNEDQVLLVEGLSEVVSF